MWALWLQTWLVAISVKSPTRNWQWLIAVLAGCAEDMQLLLPTSTETTLCSAARSALLPASTISTEPAFCCRNSFTQAKARLNVFCQTHTHTHWIMQCMKLTATYIHIQTHPHPCAHTHTHTHTHTHLHAHTHTLDHAMHALAIIYKWKQISFVLHPPPSLLIPHKH